MSRHVFNLSLQTHFLAQSLVQSSHFTELCGRKGKGRADSQAGSGLWLVAASRVSHSIAVVTPSSPHLSDRDPEGKGLP